MAEATGHGCQSQLMHGYRNGGMLPWQLTNTATPLMASQYP